MNLTQLRDFLAVIEAGSIHGAARALKISQPTLTRSIRRLEAELHIKLLERMSRGVVPTSAGNVFLTRARIVQNELSRAQEELAQLAGEKAGTVTFGVMPQAANHILASALTQFRREHRFANVRIVDGHPHELLPRLREGSLDFFIGPRSQGKLDSNIRSHPLFRSELMIAGRHGHPLRHARSLRELVDAEWLVFRPAGWAGAIVPDLFEQNGLPVPRSVVWCESYPALLALLAGTDIIGALSVRALQSRYGRGVIEPFTIKERLPTFTLNLFLRADSPLTPPAAAMMAAVKAAARQLAFSKPG